MDLSWDIIVRFGTNPTYKLPKAFFDDFVQVRTMIVLMSNFRGGREGEIYNHDT